MLHESRHDETLAVLAEGAPAGTPAAPQPRQAGFGCLTGSAILALASAEARPDHLHGADEHLAQCSGCASALAEALRLMAADSARSARQGVAPLFVSGDVVAARYRVLRLLGRGGMGEVYAVTDAVLEETVALKTLSGTARDRARGLAQLAAEIRAARRVSHPSICRYYDVGLHREPAADAGAIPFLTLEWIEGPSLRQRVQRVGALHADAACDLARQLLVALGALHAAGLVHRDVKSDNVMLRAAGGYRECVLIDLGLTQELEPDGRAYPSKLSPPGSVSHMAPEQLGGLPISPAADLFALGVVLFEALTGRSAFFHNPLALGSFPLLGACRGQKLPLRPRLFLPELSPELDAFVARCTRPSPAERYDSARAALDALDRLEHRRRL